MGRTFRKILNVALLGVFVLLGTESLSWSNGRFDRVPRDRLQKALRLQMGTRALHVTRFEYDQLFQYTSGFLANFMDGRNVDYLTLEFLVIEPQTQRLLAKVKCFTEDYLDDTFFLIQDCTLTDPQGNPLRSSQRRDLPGNIRRLGPHYYWMVHYDMVRL